MHNPACALAPAVASGAASAAMPGIKGQTLSQKPQNTAIPSAPLQTARLKAQPIKASLPIQRVAAEAPTASVKAVSAAPCGAITFTANEMTSSQSAASLPELAVRSVQKSHAPQHPVNSDKPAAGTIAQQPQASQQPSNPENTAAAVMPATHDAIVNRIDDLPPPAVKSAQKPQGSQQPLNSSVEAAMPVTLDAIVSKANTQLSPQQQISPALCCKCCR